ncbi:PfkB family carbohydrate kinase [Amnibacterium flavum]|uniref:Carbohydrate kinase n=1 Tax=Amnibacterium flavum TaxID=2173173 RepID=A0A2V1HUA6_9MICO|nr:PfkB family carbohydrate kinase [Amnibacterium flavum]PVZ93877.1 carbohydrate kinase [Amnibacterium flavum]
MTDVLVIGEALVDIVVSARGIEEHPGGSPANVALGLGRFGAEVTLLTAIAPDERGRAIAVHLEQSGVVILPESYSADRTSSAIATISADDGSADYTFDVLWDPSRTVLDIAPRIVHTGSIAAFLQPGADTVRAHVRELDADEVTFDPNIRPALIGDRIGAVATFEETAALATAVKLSDEDAAWLYPDASADEVLDRILAIGPRLAVITRGADGAVLAIPDGRVEVAAVSVDVVDTIGAGDTYMASLIDSLLRWPSAELTLPVVELIGGRAARAAAITVSRAGADLPWRDALGGDE